MHNIVPGHLYRLANFEEDSQILQFIHKEPVSKGSSDLQTIADGTTNEEVLAVLIDRLEFLLAKLPSPETAHALFKCTEALMWLERRTAKRKTRGVEGTQKA